MARNTRKSTPLFRLPQLFRKPEFRADSLGTGFLQKLYLTRQQRLILLRWGSYAFLCVAALVLQDSIMSRIPIFGARTDLPVTAMLLITVLEGTETGSVFILIASTLYYFSGSAPGPYTVAALTILGIGASLFRQIYWHRSRGSIVLCAGLAIMVYELTVFGFSVFSGLTLWSRLPRFAMTGLLSCVILYPLYPLTLKLGQIGGHTWKE